MVYVLTIRSSNERESAVGLGNVSKQSARQITELTVDKFVGFRLLQVTYKLFEHSDMFGLWVNAYHERIYQRRK